MILNELIETNCVEIYTPNVYNILWDLFIQSPNIYVKSMAFKFITHLEYNWDNYASDPLKKSKPNRITLKILNRLKKMFNKIYYLEKRSENDHFSVLLNSLSEFLSRINWIKIINNEKDEKEEKDNDKKEEEETKEEKEFNSLIEYRDYIKFNKEIHDKNREWITYKLNDGISYGIGYWTIQINSSQRPTMICIGVVTKDFYCKKCIGSNINSIGLLGDGSLWRYGQMISSQFTSTQFEAGTKISIYLDMNRRELTFTINNNSFNNDKMNDIKIILPQQSVIIFPQTTPTLASNNINNTNTNNIFEQQKGNYYNISSSAASNTSSLSNNNSFKNGIITNMSETKWYPAVSLYSKKDAIRLIKDQCFISNIIVEKDKDKDKDNDNDNDNDKDNDNEMKINKLCILPSPILKCNKYISIIKTIIAINKNELDLIPNNIICDINKWLILWIRNKNRYFRFGSFGYDIIVNSENFIKNNIQVGDMVTFSGKTCRIMGEYRNRIILQIQSNTNNLYFVNWNNFNKIKINKNSVENKFKKNYFDELKTEYENNNFEEIAKDLEENNIFLPTIKSLSKLDLISVNKEIDKLNKKTPFDLTINDFIKNNIAKNNIICGFALIRYINKYIHLLFPLFNPSTFYSYFNKLFFNINNIIFSYLKMSLILHLFTDNVDHY
eukprot:333605_1